MNVSSASLTKNIAIVGSGPTALYTLAELIKSPVKQMITIFEAQSLAGFGMPYSPNAAQALMLANIGSIEIPPLTQTYLEWLQSRSAEMLQVYGVTHDELHDRMFLPRILLGSWYSDELYALIYAAREKGHRVAIHENVAVEDVVSEGSQIRLVFDAESGVPDQFFTHVVLATGHVWPSDQEGTGRFRSPWDRLAHEEVPAIDVGIIGTSLSGMDAVLAVACQHGHFAEDGDDLTYVPNSRTGGLHITMMSRQGILPEADFWFDYPPKPLRVMTDEAVENALAEGRDGLLDRMWALFTQEMKLEDREYFDRMGLASASPEDFAGAYFKPRLATGPFDWARDNLAEVDENAAKQHAVPWRCAILDMHEKFEEIAGHLTATDQARFKPLARVFIDNYAAVPPTSIRRMLALHDAGKLTIMRLGNDYAIRNTGNASRVTTTEGEVREFKVIIDARGQKSLGACDLSFASLATSLPDGEVPVTDQLTVDTDQWRGRLYLPAAPYLLGRFPFCQGLTASAQFGKWVSSGILEHDHVIA
ncbi:FAD-NAD(P)-binding protein [Marivivens donghaensis]|uniref:FAD-NAD(P)-binding protein n=1 Tax=Marivivens donghaensis TaxID=1699413 RepID=A0ABX0W0Y7_9RHOB|nr:FAD/NAD(P)-binding protein [Marivivens donghaensis]NIY73743.1 FAD-NAD(P)-binding protein [Marivivens donghaensis]